MRILIIVPHLSTGGQPQVALKRVENLINTDNEVYLMEYRQIAWSFVVQRNKIIEILGDKFISLGWIDKEEKRDDFKKIVQEINPDIIHMEEIPEMFIFGMRKEHSDWLYREDRPYKIIETTHTSTFDLDNKKYFPDKFMFVSEYSQNQYSKFNIPSSIVEYPSDKLERNKSASMNVLGFNPDYFHILNVGLFTKDKNQGYVFEMARRLQDYKIHFHFVGNKAENFKSYWGALLEDKIDNCFVYGERDDVEYFYQATDILIHPSLLELNPLAIKEATSYDLPVFLNNLDTYVNMYDSYKNVKYLTMDVDKDVQYILDNFNIKRIDDNTTFKDLLLEEYNSVMDKEPIVENYQTLDNIKSTEQFKPNEYVEPTKHFEKIEEKEDAYLEYDINFTDGAKVSILGNSEDKFDIEITDIILNELVYKTKLSSGSWGATNNKCYSEYKVDISLNNNLLVSHKFNLKNKNVLIKLDSKSLGDTIAWFPYVEEFRKKHDCNLYCITFHNNWFEKEYPEINFLQPGVSYNVINNLYAVYSIGWYQPLDKNRNPNDFKTIPLQKTASDILGLEYKEIKPKIHVPDGARPIEEKYVCIGQFSTANAKHWHYPIRNSQKGWQILVDWLNEQGYKVMVISKQKTNLKNIIDRTGDFPIEHRLNELKHSEFFIGVGSGLSWLAWAVGKKVVMISGFSKPFCEFQTDNVNIHNFNVCNGCFNEFTFDRGDWNWCPNHKDTDRQFECTINITPKMVVDRIISTKLIENVKPFDFDKYDNVSTINKSDISVRYNKIENKFSFLYKGEEKTQPLNIEIKNYNNNETYHVLSDTILSKDYIVWCIPGTVVYDKTNIVLISFYDKNSKVDLEIQI